MNYSLGHKHDFYDEAIDFGLDERKEMIDGRECFIQKFNH
jgi:hypothetical protein